MDSHALFTSAAITVALVVARLPLTAQTPTSIPIHDLGATISRSPLKFAAVKQVVPTSGGRVFVVDNGARITYLMDASLDHAKVILDSVPGKNNTFSSGSLLIPFFGDSVLFYDRAVGALVVLAPDGAIGRVMAGPAQRIGNTLTLAGAGSSTANSDVFSPPGAGPLGLVYGVRMGPPNPDSILVVRMNFVSHQIDTLVRMMRGMSMVGPPTGRSNTTLVPAIFPFPNELAFTSDGSVAIFQGREYRIDWINPDGARTAGPRLPYAWRPITDADRTRITDSIFAIRQAAYDSAVAQRKAVSIKSGPPTVRTTLTVDANGDTAARQVRRPPPQPPVAVTAVQIPDFYPPTTGKAVLADGDNNVWIRPVVVPADPSSVLWDVVNRQGVLTERVRVPTGKTIVGFRKGGIVYLTSVDAGVTSLEQVHIR